MSFDPEPLASSSSWKCIGASVRGVSHERNGQPCQDAHAWRALGSEYIAVAVADGAGSASFSEIGARVAVQTAIAILASRIDVVDPDTDEAWLELLKLVSAEAKMAVEVEASIREIDIRELGSTLILVVASATLIAAAQIGDGAAVARTTTGELTPVTTPQNGEYLNETVFLTSPSSLDSIQTAVWHTEVAQLALFSDGLQTIALSTRDGAPYAPFFEPLFKFAGGAADIHAAQAELAGFLRSPRIESRTDDDLTLVLATHIR